MRQNIRILGFFLFPLFLVLISDKVLCSKHLVILDRLATDHVGHHRLFKGLLSVSQERVIVCSPFISKLSLDQSHFMDDIQQATRRGVEVTVYTDDEFNKKENKDKATAIVGKNMLIDAGAKVIIVDGIHNKNIIVDKKYVTDGSYNWFSADSNPKSRYHRSETTHLIQGEGVEADIGKIIVVLNALKVVKALDKSMSRASRRAFILAYAAQEYAYIESLDPEEPSIVNDSLGSMGPKKQSQQILLPLTANKAENDAILSHKDIRSFLVMHKNLVMHKDEVIHTGPFKTIHMIDQADPLLYPTEESFFKIFEGIL